MGEGAFPGTPPVVTGGVGRGAAAPARAGVSLEGVYPLISFQNSHHTCFFLTLAKSRVLSDRKCFIRETHMCGLENYSVPWGKGCGKDI